MFISYLQCDSDQPQHALSSDETEIFGIQDEVFCKKIGQLFFPF